MNKLMKSNRFQSRMQLNDIPIDLLERDALITRIENFIESGEAHYVMPINPIKVVTTFKDYEFKRIIVNADLIFPDSAGIRWALKVLYNIELSNTPGFVLMQDVLALASRKSYRVFLLGTKKKIIKSAVSILSQRYIGALFVGFHDGFFKNDEADKVIDSIKKAKPHILLVGMGVCRQEKFIVDALAHLNIPFCMGVGGSFDVITGAAPRAPGWVCTLGLEWFYRLILQPKRIKPMMALPQFVIFILRQKSQRELSL